jgi:hypothetical protein
MGVETTIIAALMGLSLASASGFRVFLPPFLLSIAVRTDTLVSLDLSDTGFAMERRNGGKNTLKPDADARLRPIKAAIIVVSTPIIMLRYRD